MLDTSAEYKHSGCLSCDAFYNNTGVERISLHFQSSALMMDCEEALLHCATL